MLFAAVWNQVPKRTLAASKLLQTYGSRGLARGREMAKDVSGQLTPYLDIQQMLYVTNGLVSDNTATPPVKRYDLSLMPTQTKMAADDSNI